MTDYTSVRNFERGKAELLATLAALPVPELSREATPGELREAKAHLEGMAKAFDRYVELLGSEVKSATREHFDESHFREPVLSALDGYALYELESCAEHTQINMREPV